MCQILVYAKVSENGLGWGGLEQHAHSMGIMITQDDDGDGEDDGGDRDGEARDGGDGDDGDAQNMRCLHLKF